MSQEAASVDRVSVGVVQNPQQTANSQSDMLLKKLSLKLKVLQITTTLIGCSISVLLIEYVFLVSSPEHRGRPGSFFYPDRITGEYQHLPYGTWAQVS